VFLRGHVPRISGRAAAISATLGLALLVSGLAISLEASELVGLIVWIVGGFVIAGPPTIWAMGRYGVLDSMEKYRRWMDAAPKREPPLG
jgi:hypothetical protein